MDKNRLGTYFLGATIACHQACVRIEAYEGLFCASFGQELKKDKDRHITIVPPFQTTYEIASKINVGGLTTTLLSTHPINSTLFSIKGLDIMEFEGTEYVHFPVRSYATGRESWDDYIVRVTKNLANIGVLPQDRTPEERRAHVTVFAGKNLSKDKDVRRIVKESQCEPELFFHAVFLNLYTKYPHGWDMLSHDPARG